MGLIELPIDDPLPSTTIHAVSRVDAPLTLPTRRLLDAFMQEAREHRAAAAQRR
jgi:hypothetical protein